MTACHQACEGYCMTAVLCLTSSLNSGLDRPQRGVCADRGMHFTMADLHHAVALYMHWIEAAHCRHDYLLTSRHEPQILCEMVLAKKLCGTLQKHICTPPACNLLPAMQLCLMHGVSAAAQHSLLHLDVLWWAATGAAIGFHHLWHHLLG